MAELTNYILEENGFDTNHPERELKKYYINADDATWRVEAVQSFKPQTNTLSYTIKAVYYDENGAEKHYAEVKFVKTCEELEDIINLCEIPIELTY